MKKVSAYFLENRAVVCSLVIYTVVFWSLRILYWQNTEEVPFSDMADYIAVADNILNMGAFGHSAFWQSYKPPTLPLFIAVLKFFWGQESLMTSWHWVVGGITYTAAWLVSREIFRQASSVFLASMFLFAVALSKSSIFWSYKIEYLYYLKNIPILTKLIEISC